MAIYPGLSLGRVGSTGASTGPHAHFEVLKDGKRYGLSQARTDIGQYLQFRKPGEKTWTPFFTKKGDQFIQAPGAVLTDTMGMRERHPVHGDRRMHYGEDYGLPQGTELRFIGSGSVATHANRGGAGNVSSLRTGPYELQTFHLSELPGAATTRPSDAGLPSDVAETKDARTEDILKAFMYGAQYQQQPEQQKTLKDVLKEQVISDVVSRALQPSSFLSQYQTSDPYMTGFNAGSKDFFGGIFG